MNCLCKLKETSCASYKFYISRLPYIEMISTIRLRSELTYGALLQCKFIQAKKLCLVVMLRNDNNNNNGIYIALILRCSKRFTM